MSEKDSFGHVPFAIFRRTGTRRLLLCVLVCLGIVGGGVMVAAAAQDVQISNVTVSPETPVTGETVTIETTIANLDSSDGPVEVTDIYVRTSGNVDEHARIEDVGSIDPGGSLSVPVSATFDSPGEKRLTVRAVTQDESGDYHRYEYPLYLDVEEPTVRADLTTSPVQNRSEMTEVELTNYGNTDLTDVEISAETGDGVVDRGFTFDVEPGSTESVTFDTSNLTGEDVTFVARYDAVGEEHTAETVTEIGDSGGVPGEIHLTRVEAAPGPGGTTIQGEAANIGSTEASSVMLRVQETERVDPQPPSHEYFVGAVEGSEFSTFELTADVDGEQATVPVEIGYNVDGERKTKTQEIQVQAGQAQAPPAGGPGQGDQQPGDPGEMNGPGGPGGPGAPGSSSGLPIVPLGIGAILVVGGFLWYRWRNQ